MKTFPPPKHLASSPAPAQPGAAAAWKSEPANGRCRVIENDLARLMKQLAETRWQAEEVDKKRKTDQRKLLLELIEVSDAFERVFENIEARKSAATAQVEIWVRNFRTVYRLLWKGLKGQGVARIENLDGLYDPHWHIPRTRILNQERPEGTIVREERRGYVWQGSLLRKAEVAVITHNPDEASDEPEAESVSD
jgi:molecular chaperone GrpE (heat shock protein)